jgi:hypothetical protein
MPKLEFSAAVRTVIADEVSKRLAPMRELLDCLAVVVPSIASPEVFAQPRLPRRGAPPPKAVELVPAPKAAAPPREIVVRRIPARMPRSSGLGRAQASASEPEIKMQAVKPFVRRRPTSAAVNVASEPAFDPFDAKIAKRFSVGQSVRYRAADGLAIAKVAAIDGATGILTLVSRKDATRFTIPASHVLAAT